MSNLMKHAEYELKKAGLFDKDSDYNGMLGKSTMKLIKVFSEEGHSGMSASIQVSLFKKLASFEPLTSITCEDDEWNEVGEGTYQNKRLSAVFKEGKDGKPYYLNAITWRTQKGGGWSGNALDSKGNKITSRQFIKLPFMPKTFSIDVIEKEIKKDDWEFYIKDEKQLEEVFKYYDKVLI